LYGNYWIGATDIAEEGSWYWLDSSPVAMEVPFWHYTVCIIVNKPEVFLD